MLFSLNLYPARKKHKSLEERFWNKVDKSDINGCWIWIGGKNSKGRAKFSVNNSNACTAARFAYEYCNGEFDLELEVLHTCDNLLCVNPEHLYLGDQQDNMWDMYSRGRRKSNQNIDNEEQAA